MWTEIHSLISGVFIFTGAFLMLVAALGVYRLPDLYLRMAATSKAATLGASLMLVGLAVYFLDVGVITRAIATVIFLFLTAPIAAHALGRAAYVTGIRPKEPILDEMHDYYPPPRNSENTAQKYPYASNGSSGSQRRK